MNQSPITHDALTLQPTTYNLQYGDWKTVRIALLFYLEGVLMFALTNPVYMLYLAMIPYCLGGIALSAIQSIFSRMVGKNEQGEIQGILSSTASAAAIVGPPLFTLVFAYSTEPSAPFHFAGAAFVLSAALFVVNLPLTSKKAV